MGNAREVEEAKRDLEDKLAHIISDTNKMELELQSEQNFHMLVRHWLSCVMYGSIILCHILYDLRLSLLNSFLLLVI